MTAPISSPVEVLEGLLASVPDLSEMTRESFTSFALLADLAALDLDKCIRDSFELKGKVFPIANALSAWAESVEKNAHVLIVRKRPTAAARHEIKVISARLRGWIESMKKESKGGGAVGDLRELFGICSTAEHLLMLLYAEPARHGMLRNVSDFKQFIQQVEDTAKALTAWAVPGDADRCIDPNFARRMSNCGDDLASWAKQARSDLHLMAGGDAGNSLNATGHEVLEGIQTLIGYWLSWVVQHGPLEAGELVA